MLLIFEPEPVTGVVYSLRTAKLVIFVSPVCSLPMLLIHGPHTFVFVTILVELDTEALLAVVSPITDIARCLSPHLTFDAAIFLSWLLFNPIYASMGSVFLSLSIGHFPEVDKWRFLLEHD